jgi:diacylglycerol kinase (ATP)
VTAAAGASRLLVVSPGAGSMTPEVTERLRRAFPDFGLGEFDPALDLRDRVGSGGTVVVAGGDGTVGFVLRALAGSGATVGILPLGTFNNFAHALGLPDDLDLAIDVVAEGRKRPVTLGRVNGHPFLEAAALGLFGEAIALGEALKDSAFGELGERLREVAQATPFRYTLTGDLDGTGRALSLVFANTPTTGARLEVGTATPADPYLELSLDVAARRLDLLGRFAASILPRRGPRQAHLSLHVRRVDVSTRPPVPVYADDQRVGTSPVSVEAEPGAVEVLVPA